MSKFDYEEIIKELRAVDDGTGSIRSLLDEQLKKLQAQRKGSEGFSSAEEGLIRDLLDRLEDAAWERKEAIRRKKIKIMTEETPGKIDLFFDNNLYVLLEKEQEELQDLALATCLHGETDGWDLSHLDDGHICCLYNPVRGDKCAAKARRGCDRVIGYILSLHPSVR